MERLIASGLMLDVTAIHSAIIVSRAAACPDRPPSCSNREFSDEVVTREEAGGLMKARFNAVTRCLHGITDGLEMLDGTPRGTVRQGAI
jgi:hypothetical protein